MIIYCIFNQEFNCLLNVEMYLLICFNYILVYTCVFTEARQTIQHANKVNNKKSCIYCPKGHMATSINITIPSMIRVVIKSNLIVHFS